METTEILMMDRQHCTMMMLDIEGSLTMQRRHSAPMHKALLRYMEIVRELVECENGFVKFSGDGCIAFFPSKHNAVSAAYALMLALAQEAWQIPGTTLRVRGAVHSGDAVPKRDPQTGCIVDYLGDEVSFTARLLTLANGGQMLFSETAYDHLHNLPKGITFRDCGTPPIRDFAELPLRVHQAIFEGVPDNRTALRQPPKLPRLFPPFIGRETELEQLSQLLVQSPLLTIVGMGGEGKTRLAVRCAELQESHYPQGAVFVDFTRLPDNSPYVAHAIAEALGLTSTQNEETEATDQEHLIAAICSHLQGRTLLLILDNCEHVPAVKPVIQAILDRCREISILATSRNALHINGEKRFELDGMPLPETTDALETVKTNPAVKLFLESASGLELTPSNKAQIVRICRRSSGIALVLELIAGLYEFYTLDDMESEVAARLPEIMGEGKEARHGTLAAMLHSSYERLDDKAKTLFQRVTVLLGNPTRSVIAEVCGDSSTPKETQDALNHLVHHRLIVSNRKASGETSYSMREPVRQYAADKLSAAEGAALRCRHLEYFTQFAQTKEPELRTAHFADAQKEIADAYDNIRAALEYRTDPLLCLELSIAMARYWQSDRFREGAELLQRALTNVPDAEPILRGKALARLGNLLMQQSNYEEARCRLKESIALLQPLDTPRETADALLILGHVEMCCENPNAARCALAKSLALNESMGVKSGTAACLSALGDLDYDEGKWVSAKDYYQRSAEIFRAMENDYRCQIVACNVALVEHELGHYEKAVALFQTALELFETLQDRWHTAINLNNLAVSLCAVGKKTEAARKNYRSLMLVEQLGDKAGTLLPLLTACHIAQKSERFDKSAQIMGILHCRIRTLDQELPHRAQKHVDEIRDHLIREMGEADYRQQFEDGAAKVWNQALIFLEDYIRSLEESP